jgi:4-hydroxyphenylacetate 3-monooxygenase
MNFFKINHAILQKNMNRYRHDGKKQGKVRSGDMPAINGTQLKERIGNLQSNIWFDGQKVTGDIVAHPAFKGVINSKARLYDFQLEEENLPLMTYKSPTTGNRVGRSFHPPLKKEDLELRRLAAGEWAKLTGGMMGRTPDYMNTALMALGASAHVFEGKNKLGRNVTCLYEKARENDLTFSHTYVTPQVNRSLAYFEEKEQPISARVVKKTADGIFIKGARLLATQGGITDELMVLPAGGKFIEEDYVYAFSVPSSTENLKFVCRESFVYNDSHFDHPLGSRFEEMDTIVIFDNTFVPWERVFLYKDINAAMNLFNETNFNTFLVHQTLSRQLTKSRLFLGTAQLITETIGIGKYQHVKEKISEIICGVEMMKGLLLSSEMQARENSSGLMVPDASPLTVASLMFPKFYPRFVEILQLLGASGTITIPTSNDFKSDLRSDLDLYLQGADTEAKERVQLFRLAWDMCSSAFAGRETIYERFFFGDPARISVGLYNQYDKKPAVDLVNDLLKS